MNGGGGFNAIPLGGIGGVGGPGLSKFGASSARQAFPSASVDERTKGMFATLRRLHGQGVECRGLADLSEAANQLLTRAKFFSVGRLRRTWSHSAVDFIKFRKLLPMLLDDGQQAGSIDRDNFDAALAMQANARARVDARRIAVANVSPKVAQNQLHSFFQQFGAVSHVQIASEPVSSISSASSSRTSVSAVVTFKRPEDAERARTASADQLVFLEHLMTVTAYSSRRRAESRSGADLSRTPSAQSLQSLATFPLDSLPDRILERVFGLLPAWERVRLERVSRRFREVSLKSWWHARHLSLSSSFTGNRPMRAAHLDALLRRGGLSLESLDFSGTPHLLDEGNALSAVGRHCKRLKRLDASGVAISWRSLRALSDTLENLGFVGLRDARGSVDRTIWFLVKASTGSLKALDVRGSRRFRGAALRLLGDKMERVWLDGCNRLEPQALEWLCASAAAQNLRELRMDGCWRAVGDRELSMVARTLGSLRVVSLRGDRYVNLTSQGLQVLAYLEKLEELLLDDNSRVDDELLILLSNASAARYLRILGLANAGTDATLTETGCAAIGQFKALEKIDLSSVSAVRASSLAAIGRGCSNLETLVLRSCLYVNGVTVGDSLSASRKLTYLDLSGAMLVTNEGVQRLVDARKSTLNSSAIETQFTGRPLTIVVGGTACQPTGIRLHGSGCALDLADYTDLGRLTGSITRHNLAHSEGNDTDGDDADEDEDDEFGRLVSQSSFMATDALRPMRLEDLAADADDDSPETDDPKKLAEWAEREVRRLGLVVGPPPPPPPNQPPDAGK